MQEHEHDPSLCLKNSIKGLLFRGHIGAICVWNFNYFGHTLTISSDNVVIPKKWNEGEDCWSTSKCDPREGPCIWCGAEGMCCRYDKLVDKNSGCHSSEMKRRMEQLRHHSDSKKGHHLCIWKQLFHLSCAIYFVSLVIFQSTWLPILNTFLNKNGEDDDSDDDKQKEKANIAHL